MFIIFIIVLVAEYKDLGSIDVYNTVVLMNSDLKNQIDQLFENIVYQFPCTFNKSNISIYKDPIENRKLIPIRSSIDTRVLFEDFDFRTALEGYNKNVGPLILEESKDNLTEKLMPIIASRKFDFY